MSDIGKRREKPSSDTWRYWGVMTFYERFEQVVALLLSAVVSVVVVIALWHLIREVFVLLVLGGADPLEHRIFQRVFGMMMTLLIAMEFKHSIIKVLERRANIIQVRTVILIALLALSRKFIVLDSAELEAGKLAALGFATLVLGTVYWLLRDRDERALARAEREARRGRAARQAARRSQQLETI